MKLTRTELKYLKKWKMLSPKTFPFKRNLLRRKRAKTIGELLQAASPEDETFEPPTFYQQTVLNQFFLQASSVEEIQTWIAERS